MKVIVPSYSNLIYSGKVLDINLNHLPNHTGKSMSMIFVCRGVQLPLLPLHLIPMYDQSMYIIEQRHANDFLKYIIKNHKRTFNDILSKYNTDVWDNDSALCVDEILRTTIDSYHEI